MFAATTRGDVRYDRPRYETGDVFVFGSETRGLPREILMTFPPEMRIKLPMRDGSRSLNLSNAVAIAVYEAWRQLNFEC
jgi:tRNA (cytidine/uridine-2'-O-)-methyltransferase